MCRGTLLRLAACAVLALPLAACGDDSGEDESTSSATSTLQAGAPSAPQRAAGGAAADGEVALSGNREEARQAAETTTDIYQLMQGIERTGGKALIARGGGGLCRLMSRRSRRDTVEYVRRSSGLAELWNCKKAIALLLGRSQRRGRFDEILRTEVVGVNVDGNRATATIRSGPRKPLTSVPLIKEDGKWKLGSKPSTGDE